MSAFTTLRALINAQINTNGTKAITGAKLNGVLLQMVDELGAECQFGGLVLPSTPFTAGDFPVAFLATAAGTYTAFGGAVLDGAFLHILAWDGSAWSDTATDIPAGALEDYAKKDGYYASLTAGAALNLVGRDSVPAQYLFRTTGGTADVGTGSAVLSSIKGRSIVWNQLVQPGVGSVATISGHKYLTRIAGVDAIVTSTGDAILVDDASKDNVHDLTLLGLGDLTIAQFRALFPLDYYEPNAGEVLPFAGEKLVTTGFNQWDEEWEFGRIDLDTGILVTDTNMIRSKNYIPIIGGKDYCASTPNSDTFGVYVMYYDAEKQPIIPAPAGNYKNEAHSAPGNARFAKFYCSQGYGTIYKSDICINLSWSGIRNGEYEPYEKHELAVNPATLLDKDGNLVFPYGGMHGVGTAFDSMKPEADGFIHYANRVFARVDLGDLTWTKYKDYGFSTSIVNAKTFPNNNGGNAVLANYIPRGTQITLTAGEYTIGNNILYVVNSSIKDDAAAFKAAMDGVYLVYELATPAVVELAEPIAASYYANDWGTEEWQPANGTEPYTAPCNVDVQYAMNAVDLLRNLPRNYIGAEDFDTYNAALAQALASVGITMTYARTFNQQTDHHEFTITMAQSE